MFFFRAALCLLNRLHGVVEPFTQLCVTESVSLIPKARLRIPCSLRVIKLPMR